MTTTMKCPACGVTEEHIRVLVSGDTHSTFSFAVPGRVISLRFSAAVDAAR